MARQRRSGIGGAGYFLILMGAFLVLVVLGILRGDFQEILVNGTTL